MYHTDAFQSGFTYMFQVFFFSFSYLSLRVKADVVLGVGSWSWEVEKQLLKEQLGVSN